MVAAGDRSNPVNVVEGNTGVAPGFMVWGAVGYDFSSPLITGTTLVTYCVPSFPTTPSHTMDTVDCALLISNRG